MQKSARNSFIVQRRLALAAIGLAALPLRARSQTVPVRFPERALKILVGFSAGSPSDLLARALADKLTHSLGQPAVVENKPGAGGILAVRTLLQSPPDGHTLLVVSAAHAATPVVTRNPGFDAIHDLAGITRIANVPSVLIVNPKLSIRTLGELVARLNQAPGAMNFSTPGKGSANHFGTEYFLAQAKAKATHVPYKGVPEAVTAVISGECQFSLVPAPNALQLVKGGQVVALAVCTATRAAVLPQVSTIAEAGIAGFRFDPWFGVLTQAAVPAAVRAKLIAASTTALAAPDLRTRFATIGAEISPLPGERFDAYIQAEIAKFRYIAASAGIEAS